MKIENDKKIDRLIKKIVSESKETKKVNELFGFSKKEKEQKDIKMKLEKAFNEIDAFNFQEMLKPIFRGSQANEDQLANMALAGAVKALPTVNIIMPSLFPTGGRVGGTSAYTNIGEEITSGVVPSTFSFLVDSDGALISNEMAKARLKSRLDKFVQDTYFQ